MKKLYFIFAGCFFYINTTVAQVTTYFSGIDNGMSFIINGDYLYYIDANVIKRANISNPLFLAPPTITLYDPPFSPLLSIGIKGNELYISEDQVIYSDVHKVDLTNLALPSVLVSTGGTNQFINFDFYSNWLYTSGHNWLGLGLLHRLNTTDALPATSTTYINKLTRSLCISSTSLYFSADTYTPGIPGIYSEIYFKNLNEIFAVSPLVLKYTSSTGTLITDLFFFEGLLYFTDNEGLKRMNPTDIVPTPVLLLSNVDYVGTLASIKAKSYVTGQKYLFVMLHNPSGTDHSILRVDLNHPTLSNEETSLLESTIYPNPTSGNIFIKSNSDIQKLSVADMTGKTVFEINTTNYSHESELDFSNFTAGCYFLNIKTSVGSETKKIIKK